MEVGAETRQEPRSGQECPISWDNETNAQTADQRVGEMLQLIVATREYQFA
jgi:hypothetical protein